MKKVMVWIWVAGLLVAGANWLRYLNAPIDMGGIATLNDMVIKDPVEFKRVNKSRYYTFRFLGHSNEFRFYDYHKFTAQIDSLKQWDTVSIQIDTAFARYIANPHSTGELKLLNLSTPSPIF